MLIKPDVPIADVPIIPMEELPPSIRQPSIIQSDEPHSEKTLLCVSGLTGSCIAKLIAAGHYGHAQQLAVSLYFANGPMGDNNEEALLWSFNLFHPFQQVYAENKRKAQS